jgi:hypothetical protein
MGSQYSRGFVARKTKFQIKPIFYINRARRHVVNTHLLKDQKAQQVNKKLTTGRRSG